MTETVQQKETPRTRRRERGAGGAWRTVLVWLVVLAVLGTTGYLVWRAAGRRMAAAKQLDSALQLIKQADEVVLDVDDVVRAEVSEDVAMRAEALIERIPDAEQDIQEAVGLIDSAYPRLTEHEQLQADAMKDAAEARLKMFKVAPTVLEANVKAGYAFQPAKDGWDMVLEGSSLSKEAVKSYNKLTKAGVSQSSRLNSQAQQKVEGGKRLMSKAATNFPEADLTKFLAYADAKLALIAISRSSDSAWLRGKVEDANKLIAKYNTEEARVIALAKVLPESTGKVIADAYEKLAASPTDEYFKAREKASSADNRLKQL